MCGKHKCVAALVMKKATFDVYIHCHAHRLPRSLHCLINFMCLFPDHSCTLGGYIYRKSCIPISVHENCKGSVTRWLFR